MSLFTKFIVVDSLTQVKDLTVRFGVNFSLFLFFWWSFESNLVQCTGSYTVKTSFEQTVFHSISTVRCLGLKVPPL